MGRPAKRARLLEDDSDGDGPVPHAFKINEEYAKRHGHNAARAERHRLEEKYKDEPEDDEPDSETDDDEGELATKELDDQILATLQAIKSKDPRVYNKDVKFYTDEEIQQQADKKSKSKPVTLRDYHRQNLLAGNTTNEEDSSVPTYEQEQSDIKKDLLKQMHEMPEDDNDESSDSDGGGFLVRKPEKEQMETVTKEPELDPTTADKDPETYLSNFMASRAWTVDSGPLQPLESDEEDELDRAETFEAAYNLRFEDPNKINETLISHSRQAAEKYSVRREDPKGRKRARQDEKARREEEKIEREGEKARLRRFKIEDAHEKWIRLKEAAGLKNQNLPDEKLVKFLERGFEDDKWDQQMAKLLGDDYYEKVEEDAGNSDAETSGKRSKKLKKPVWDADIDIGDIDPEFTTREEQQSTGITLSDDEGDAEEASTRPKSKKEAEKKRSDLKRQARLERRKIEETVDSRLEDTLPLPKHAGFRYRETSPSALGLSARDILMADDAQLNQYAGLKKLAAFRDEHKKQKDRKNLGKKARLRQWRKDTFGTEEQAKDEDFEAWFNRNRGIYNRDEAGPSASAVAENTTTGERDAKKKRKKRSRKQNSSKVTV